VRRFNFPNGSGVEQIGAKTLLDFLYEPFGHLFVGAFALND
jgi:hypothetical protein